MLETVISILVLVMFFMASIEVFQLITTRIHLEKIAREVAREMAQNGDLGESYARYMAGEKFNSIANQYFPGNKPNYNITIDSANNYVLCVVSYGYKPGKYLFRDGMGAIVLDAKAFYPWFDRNI